MSYDLNNGESNQQRGLDTIYDRSELQNEEEGDEYRPRSEKLKASSGQLTTIIRLMEPQTNKESYAELERLVREGENINEQTQEQKDHYRERVLKLLDKAKDSVQGKGKSWDSFKNKVCLYHKFRANSKKDIKALRTMIKTTKSNLDKGRQPDLNQFFKNNLKKNKELEETLINPADPAAFQRLKEWILTMPKKQMRYDYQPIIAQVDDIIDILSKRIKKGSWTEKKISKLLQKNEQRMQAQIHLMISEDPHLQQEAQESFSPPQLQTYQKHPNCYTHQ